MDKRFLIQSKIGQGSNANIYAARQISNNKRYALKMIEKNLVSKEFECLIINEIKFQRHLEKCSGLLKMYEVFECE